MTYDEGVLEMMSPSALHEHWSDLIGRLIGVWTLELSIDIMSCGSMTVSRKDLQKGFEPDKCYYVEHEPQMRRSLPRTARAELDFKVDPPPDLAIEVDVSRSSVGKRKLYAAFGVPEVWRYDGQRLEVLTLGPEQGYLPSAKSLCFPGIPLDEMTRILGRMNTESETVLVRSFRDHVRREIVRDLPS